MNRATRRRRLPLGMSEHELALARQLLTQVGGNVAAAGGKVLAWNDAANTPAVVLWSDTGQISAHFDGLPDEVRNAYLQKRTEIGGQPVMGEA